MDAKGSIRRLQRTIEVREGSKGVEWEGGVDSHCPSGAEIGNDDGLFEYFGDYLRPKIDTKNVHIVDGVWRNPRRSDHRVWSTVDGDCLVRQPDVEEIEDGVRRVAEISDSLDGFMFLLDDTSLWGHVASQILENMQHDYAGTSKVVFATRERDEGCDEARLALLEGLATSCISSLVDLYVPMVDPVVEYPILASRYERQGHPRRSLFRHSLLKAVGIHGATAPCYRAGDDQLDIRSLIGLLTGHYNRPFASMDMVFPGKLAKKDSTLFKSDTRVSFNQDTSLGSDSDSGRFAESISILHEAEFSRDAVLDRIKHDTVRRVQSVAWCENGIPHLPYMAPCPENTDSLGIICRLCGTTSFKNVLESVSTSFKRASESAMGSKVVASWGIPHEEVIEAYNNVESLAVAYKS